MIVSSDWESMSDVRDRTGLRAERVIEIVREGLGDGSIELRLPEPDQGVSVCLIRAKARGNAVARVVGEAVAKSDVKDR